MAEVLLFQPPQALAAVQRLIVLVPDHPVAEARLARQLLELTQPRQTDLVLLTQVTEPRRALRARRRLATLAAMARDLHNRVETSLVTTGWVAAVRAVWQPGDLVLCHAEQRVARWGRPVSLAETLMGQWRIPVYLLTGYYPRLREPAAAPWMRRLTTDLVAVAIVVVFLYLQIEALAMASVWAGKLLVVLSILAEFGLLLGWHNFNSRDVHDE